MNEIGIYIAFLTSPELKSLSDLKNQAAVLEKYNSKISVSEEVGDVQVFFMPNPIRKW